MLECKHVVLLVADFEVMRPLRIRLYIRFFQFESILIDRQGGLLQFMPRPFIFTIAVRAYTSATKFQPSTVQPMASHSSGLLFFDSLVQRGIVLISSYSHVLVRQFYRANLNVLGVSPCFERSPFPTPVSGWWRQQRTCSNSKIFLRFEFSVRAFKPQRNFDFDTD